MAILKTTELAKYITRTYGFPAFYNADGFTVSFYIPFAVDGKLAGEILLTVTNYREADIACGM